MTSRISIALLHYPILDKEKNIVTTAITNLDLHDMARSAKTYGVDPLFIVHPIDAQRELAQKIKDHWVLGSGKKRIPDRAIAMEVLEIRSSLNQVVEELQAKSTHVQIWTTAASSRSKEISTYNSAKTILEETEDTILILFGTGWGLPEQILDQATLRLEPIQPKRNNHYNHLSVRAACSITLDRLLG